MIDRDRLRKAAVSCGMRVVDDVQEAMYFRYCGHRSRAIYNNKTGELTYDPKHKDTEEVQCLKRTLASEPPTGEPEGEK